MPLKALVKDPGEIPEAFKSMYREDTTLKAFVLDVEAADGFELANTSGLKSALQKERGEVATVKQQLAQFKDIDPTAAKDALKLVEQYKNADPTQQAQKIAEAQVKELQTKFAQKEQDYQSRLKGTIGQLENVLVINSATQAILEEKGVPDLLLPHVTRHIKMREVDAGKMIAEVVDGNGVPRIGDMNGNPMTIPDLVKEFKANPTFAPAFDATGAKGSGSGTDPNSRRTTAGNKRPNVIQNTGVLTVNPEDLLSGKTELQL